MNQSLLIARCRINGITLEVSYGEIDDIYRRGWFPSITEFELPKTKGSDDDFEVWLDFYRPSSPELGKTLLEISKCN